MKFTKEILFPFVLVMTLLAAGCAPETNFEDKSGISFEFPAGWSRLSSKEWKELGLGTNRTLVTVMDEARVAGFSVIPVGLSMGDQMAFGAMGIPPLPRSAFGDALFLTDWVDSEESQAILHYQRYDAATYFEEVSAELGPARPMMKLIGPALVPIILAHSRHHALVERKRPWVPDAYRSITTFRRALKAAKSYF